MSDQRSYDGFISYRQVSDHVVAARLQQALQKLGKPRFRTRALRICRDQTDLGANSGLWPTICRSLERSRYFILLASPMAAKSKWVCKEVQWWLDHRSVETLLIALTRGTIFWGGDDFDWESSDALPAELRGKYSEEPGWIDLREAVHQNRLSLDDESFQRQIAALAAPMHGPEVRPSDLISRELVEQRRLKRWAWSAAGVLQALLIAVAIFAGVTKHQAVAAELRASAAEASALVDADPVRALLLALTAVDRNHTSIWVRRRMLPEVLRSLPAAVQHSRERSKVTAHGGKPVRAVAFDPIDDRRLATGGADGTVAVWQTQDDGLQEIFRSDALPGKAEVRAVAFSRDGRFLAGAGDDGRVRLWDAGGGLVTEWTVSGGRFQGSPCGESSDEVWPAAPVCGLAFGPGDQLLAGDSRGRLHLWDLRGEPLATPIDSHRGFVSAVAFGVVSELGRDPRSILVSGGDDHSDVGTDTVVRLWELDGRPLRQLDDGSYGNVADLATDGSSYGSTIAVARAMKLYPLEGHTVIRWYAGGGEGSAPLDDRRVSARAVAFGLENTLAAGWDDGSIQIWHTGADRPLGPSLIGHRTGTAVTSLDFSPDGQRLASGGEDGTVRIWDSQPIPRFAPPFDGQTQSADQVSVNGGAVVAEWQPRTGDRSVLRLWIDGPEPARRDLVFEGDPIGPYVLEPRSRRLAAAERRDGRVVVKIWDLAAASALEPTSLEVAGNRVPCMSFSADGSRLAWAVEGPGGSELHVRLLDSKAPGWKLPYDGPTPDSMAFSRDRARIAVVGGDRLRVFDVERGAMAFESGDLDPNTWQVWLFPEADRLVTRSYEALRLWQLDGEFRRPPTPLGDPIQLGPEPMVSSRGRFLMTADPGGKIQTRSFDGELMHQFQHEGGVTALAANDDRTLIVTGFTADVPQGGGDSVIRLWDGEGRPLARFDWLGDLVEEVGLMAGGKWIWGRSVFNRYQLWPGDWPAWMAIACERLAAHPTLTHPEELAGPELRRLAHGARSACEHREALPALYSAAEKDTPE